VILFTPLSVIRTKSNEPHGTADSANSVALYVVGFVYSLMKKSGLLASTTTPAATNLPSLLCRQIRDAARDFDASPVPSNAGVNAAVIVYGVDGAAFFRMRQFVAVSVGASR